MKVLVSYIDYVSVCMKLLDKTSSLLLTDVTYHIYVETIAHINVVPYIVYVVKYRMLINNNVLGSSS